jgi:hypothetical protein
MNRALCVLGGFMAIGICPQLPAQALQQEIQQKLATVKESVARNKASLRQYTWTEQDQILYKGEVKKTTQYICRYGADGKVQKTQLGQPAPEKHKRGLRGKIVEEKTDEMKDYMQRAVALIHNYVPPSPEQMEAARQNGNVMVGGAGPGQIQLQLKNYVKQGDSMSFVFNQSTKSLTSVNVNSYLDDAKDAVSLQVTFQLLPDGTNYAANTVLNAPAKSIQVNLQNTNYQKLAM